jgi:hypothetical protein
MHQSKIYTLQPIGEAAGWLFKTPNQRRAEMKKIILGTLAAATVIASATAASAQNRMDRKWDMRMQTSASQTYDSPSRRNANSYGYNLRFEAADRVN